MLDAGDVEEMVLVIVDEKPFHLGRVHAAIGLGDIENRDAEVGENVAGHPLDGEKTRHSTAMTSTRIVIGRRKAKETKFIRSISCRAVHP